MDVRLWFVLSLSLAAVVVAQESDTNSTKKPLIKIPHKTEVECKSIRKIDRVMRYHNVLLFADGDGPELYSLRIGNLSKMLKVVKVSSLSKSLKFIRSGFHFNLLKACSNVHSNPRFCRISKLYNNHVIFFGESADSRNRKFSFNYFNESGLTPEEAYEDGNLYATNYTAPKPAIEQSGGHTEVHDGGVLELKVKQILYTFYINYLSNKMLDFKGITYEHEADALYTIADVVPDNIALDSSYWRIGKHVMFRANFSPHGLIQDSYHAAHFDEPKTGIFSHNGAIYVLNSYGTHFDEYRDDKPTDKSYNLREMFCMETSPLMKTKVNQTLERSERAKEYNEGNVVPNMAQFLFPHIPDFIRVMEPPFLQGYSYFTLVIFLAFAFVIMCVINVFTIMEDVKMDRRIRSRMKRMFRRRDSSRREGSSKRGLRGSRISCHRSTPIRDQSRGSTDGSSSATEYSMILPKEQDKISGLTNRKHPSQTTILPSPKRNPSLPPDIYRSYSKRNNDSNNNQELSQEDIERDSSPGNYPDDN